MKSKKFLVISGPTGSGESTITSKIIHINPNFLRLITATTRRLRSGERDEVDYFFFSKEKFEKLIKEGEIVEYTYIKNRDVYYGTYKPYLEDKISKGFVLIGNLDIVGAKYYKENYNATTIFLKTDSIEDLEKRIKNRDKEITEEELQKRIENAKEEIKNEEEFYDYVVINRNGKLEETLNEIKRILKKEGYDIKK